MGGVGPGWGGWCWRGSLRGIFAYARYERVHPRDPPAQRLRCRPLRRAKAARFGVCALARARADPPTPCAFDPRRSGAHPFCTKASGERGRSRFPRTLSFCAPPVPRAYSHGGARRQGAHGPAAEGAAEPKIDEQASRGGNPAPGPGSGVAGNGAGKIRVARLFRGTDRGQWDRAGQKDGGKEGAEIGGAG